MHSALNAFEIVYLDGMMIYNNNQHVTMSCMTNV